MTGDIPFVEHVAALIQALDPNVPIHSIRRIENITVLAEAIVLRAYIIDWFREEHTESLEAAIERIAPEAAGDRLEAIVAELHKLEFVADNQLYLHWTKTMIAAIASP